MIQRHSGHEGIYAQTVISYFRWIRKIYHFSYEHWRTGLRVYLCIQSKQAAIRWNPRDFTGAWDRRTWPENLGRTAFCCPCPPPAAAAYWEREKGHRECLKGSVMAWKQTRTGEWFLKCPVAPSHTFSPTWHLNMYSCFGLLLAQTNIPPYLTMTV